MKIRFHSGEIRTRPSINRIPFRYGNACMTECPQALCAVNIEIDGQPVRGYSGDCLPPRWFDKSPEKDFTQQLDEMRQVMTLAVTGFIDGFSQPEDFFRGWREVYKTVQRQARELSLTPLLASFGVSFWERAIMDAICRAHKTPFAQAARENLFGIVAGDVHASLREISPGEWLPANASTSIFVRHTVGLGDPLTAADLEENSDLSSLDDCLPVTLEDYVKNSGLRYVKVKVANNLQRDLDRLEVIASIMESERGSDYQVTLDGNEQYKTAGEFDALIEAIRANRDLAVLWENILVVEQPLERSIALDSDHTAGVRMLGQSTPVIIDESDGTLEAYPQAIELGYRGVSSKSCKGPIKSLLNAGLTWLSNQQNPWSLVMTGEDLCTVGVIPVQSDLCLVATIGLTHVERNGHHFHRGLSYLSESEQRDALAKHPDFYERFASNAVPFVGPRIEDGQFHIESLLKSGFGFSVVPDLDLWTPFVSSQQG